MTPPVLPPPLKPFEEAVDFHRERTPRVAEDFAAVDSAVRMRSFTLAGLTKLDAVTAAYHLALESITTGQPVRDFEQKLQRLVVENGGSLLPRSRVDLVFRNNNAVCTSAGRWRQIIEGGIADARPYGRYPLGPDDGSTTSICRLLQGLVFPLRSQLAKRIWPPNHHNERHINVVTLTEEQARASGRMYEGDPNDEYPFIENPAVGHGARVMPEPGFDFDPDLLAADGAYLRRKAGELGEPLPIRKTPAQYGLAPLAAAFSRELPQLPLGADADGADERWSEFREAFGFAPDSRSTMLADFAGDGVIVTRESLDALPSDVPASLFAALAAAVQDPFEVWMIPHGSAAAPQLLRRYIALFDDGAPLAVTVDRSPDGWLMRAAIYRGVVPESIRRGFPTTTKSSPLAR